MRDFTFEHIRLEKSWVFHSYHVNHNRCQPHLLVSCFHRIKGHVLIGVRTFMYPLPSTKSRKLNCFADMAEMRWILSYFTVIALLLLMSQSFPGSAHESVLNPLNRVLVGQHEHLQQQEKQLAVEDNSIYNWKTCSWQSIFSHSKSIIFLPCGFFSLHLSFPWFLYDVVQRNGVFYFVFKNLKALKCMILFLFFYFLKYDCIKAFLVSFFFCSRCEPLFT